MKRLPLLSAIIVCILVPSVAAFAGAAKPAAGLGGGGTGHGGGYLGVDFENLTKQQRKNLSIPSSEGVAIAAVDHDAPAGKAGLRANDVIVALNGKKSQSAEGLVEALHKMSPGQTVTLDVMRDGSTFQVKVVLADRKLLEEQAWSQHYTVPDPQAQPAQQGFFASVPAEISKTFSSNGGLMSYIPGTPPYTGLVLDVMNPQLARYFGLKNSTGLLVKSVDPNSPAFRAGIQAGDVICKADDLPMTSRSRWNHALRQNRHESVKLFILRNRHPQTIVLTFAPSKS